MRLAVHIFSLCFVLPLIGCGSKPGVEEEKSHGHEAHDEHETDHPKKASPESNEVHIEESMLRDLRVTTQAADVRPTAEGVTALGELGVNENEYAEVGTSVPARVSRIFVQTGDVVSAGQALVELESLEVGQARASVLSTRARLALTRQVAERRRALGAEQIVPEREVQSAEAELKEADASHRAAEGTLVALNAQRGMGSRFVLSSPIAGTVIDRTALRGQMIDREQSLFVIGELSRLWLTVHVFERDALRIKVGAEALVTLAGLPGQTLRGPVTRVGSRVDPVSRTMNVRIELDNQTGILRPGMSATARLPIGDAAETVIAVPIEALQRQGQGWCVFIPEKEPGHFQIRAVGRGRDLGAEVEIVSGLQPGERVVVDGAFLLKAEADKARGGAEEHHH